MAYHQISPSLTWYHYYTLGTESSSNDTGKIKLSSTGTDTATTVTIQSNNTDLLTVASDAAGTVTLKPAD